MADVILARTSADAHPAASVPTPSHGRTARLYVSGALGCPPSPTTSVPGSPVSSKTPVTMSASPVRLVTRRRQRLEAAGRVGDVQDSAMPSSASPRPTLRSADLSLAGLTRSVPVPLAAPRAA